LPGKLPERHPTGDESISMEFFVFLHTKFIIVSGRQSNKAGADFAAEYCRGVKEEFSQPFESE
jgi:hypothetical protein